MTIIILLIRSEHGNASVLENLRSYISRRRALTRTPESKFSTYLCLKYSIWKNDNIVVIYIYIYVCGFYTRKKALWVGSRINLYWQDSIVKYGTTNDVVVATVATTEQLLSYNDNIWLLQPKCIHSKCHSNRYLIATITNFWPRSTTSM